MVRFLVAKRSILLQHRALYIFLWLLSKQCLLGTTSLALYTPANCELGFELSSADLAEPRDESGHMTRVQRALQRKRKGLRIELA